MAQIKEIIQRISKGVNSRFNRGVIWNISSLGVLAVGGILLDAIILKFSDAETLGVFNQVFSIYLILSQIGAGGIQFSVLKSVSHNQEDKIECARITTSGLVLSGIVSTFIVLLAIILAGPVGIMLDSTAVSEGLRLALPGLIFFALNKVLINAINGHRHMRAYAVFKALRYVFILGIAGGIILLELPNIYLSISLFLSEVFLFIPMLLYVNLKLYSIFKVKNIIEWFKPHLVFGLKGFMSGILITLMIRIDVLVLGYFSSDEVVGIYSFAATVATGFLQIPFAIRWNVDPIIGDYIAKGELKKVEEISKKIRRVFFPLMIVVGILAVALYPIMMAVINSDSSNNVSWAIFSIIMIGVTAGASYSPFIGIFLQGGRPEVHTFLVGGLAALNAILGIILVPVFGIYGAAISASTINILSALSIKYFSKRILSIQL
jgi:O-antigen/teichoic acid export membrane protein